MNRQDDERKKNNDIPLRDPQAIQNTIRKCLIFRAITDWKMPESRSGTVVYAKNMERVDDGSPQDGIGDAVVGFIAGYHHAARTNLNMHDIAFFISFELPKTLVSGYEIMCGQEQPPAEDIWD